MRVLVDADACPVKHIITRVAREYGLQVIMFCDTSHEINDTYSIVVTVDKQRDSVDIAIINQTNSEDIVVTQDYGLAAMVLGKHAKALNQNGLVYTQDNIERLLSERYVSQKIRRSGARTAGPPKRSKADDNRFESAFRRLIL